MAKDDDLDAWDEAMDDNAAPQIGANKELLRKAMALNPGLRENGIDSNTLLDQLQNAKAEKPAAAQGKKPAAAAATPGRTLTEVVRALKQELDAKRKQIAAERAALDAKERALKPEVCDRMLDAVLEIDPNMTSPKTAFILNQEKTFLDSIGFSTQKLVEREARKK